MLLYDIPGMTPSFPLLQYQFLHSGKEADGSSCTNSAVAFPEIRGHEVKMFNHVTSDVVGEDPTKASSAMGRKPDREV